MFRKSSYTVIRNTSFPRTEIIKSSHWVFHLYFKITWSSRTDVHHLRSRIKSNFHLPPPVQLTKWQNIPGVMSVPQSCTNLIRGFTFPHQNNQQQDTFWKLQPQWGQQDSMCITALRAQEHLPAEGGPEAETRAADTRPGFLKICPKLNTTNKASPTGSIPTHSLFTSVMPSQCLCTTNIMHPLLLQATYITLFTGSTFAFNSVKIPTASGQLH